MTAPLRFLLLPTALLLLPLLLFTLSTEAQILGSGQCRLTAVFVREGGQVCERYCYQRGFRGNLFQCRPVARQGIVQICGNGCCRSGPNCHRLLRV
ncbi:hypothetical protein KR009_006826 [Drosophila setifemur]|nr:hypothetical protein KR009_006826 [Drosophila setifemur]